MKNLKVYQTILEENFRSIDASDAVYSANLVEIEGLVSPVSQGGWVRKEFHTHRFDVVAWRYENQAEIYHSKVLIMRPVEANASYLREIPPYTVVKLKVWLCEDLSRAICKEVYLLENQGTIFEPIALELMKPIEKETALFGTLVFDKSIEWFEGNAFWQNESVRVYLSTDKFGNIDQALEVAEKLWKEQTEWNTKIKNYVIEEMLPTKNDYWLGIEDEMEQELTPIEFINRIKLESIHFENNGNFTFWYDDGWLFLGHSIAVEGNITSGLTEANMHG